MTQQILIAQEPPALFKKAAQLIVDATAEAIKNRGKASWSLCGGRGPQSLFPLLAEPYYRERIDWQNVIVCWGDERCVPPDHPESNYKLAHDLLLSKVRIPSGNIFRMPGEMASAQEAARAYEQALKVQFRYERPFPKFDVMLLGVGEDGHTASLFPGTSALEEKEKWVIGHRVEKLGANRLTLTFPVINNARNILMLCPGESKAAVLRDVFWSEAPQTRYPVQLVKPVDGNIYWLLDRGSASRLTADAQKQAQQI